MRPKLIFALCVVVHFVLTVVTNLWLYLWWAVLGQAAVDSGTAVPAEPMGLSILSFAAIVFQLPLTFLLVAFQKAGFQDTIQLICLISPFNSFLAVWIAFRCTKRLRHW